MTKITVLLADDHEVVRQGLRALLSAQPDMEVVGEAENGREAVTLAAKTSPDIVVMDIAMPVLNGLAATREILHRLPDTKVVVLSSYDDKDCVAELIEAGASSYLTKRSAAGELADAIRAVRRGKTYFGPEIQKQIQERERAALTPGGAVRRRTGLTKREAEVLQLIAEGFPNKGIAAQLGISVKTVEKHRQSVMNKLNIHETAGLTRFAVSKNIVPDRTQGSEAAPLTQPQS